MRRQLLLLFGLLTGSLASAQPLCDFQGKDSLLAIVSGDTIHVWDIAACAYCSAMFDARVTAEADTITIVQTDTAGRIATCACLFDMRTSISGLVAGTYWIVLYRDLLKRYGYPSDVRQLIGSIRVSYSATAPPGLSWNAVQSGCNPVSVGTDSQTRLEEFALLQNYPNPFNPSTTVRFQTPRSAYVVIRLFDVLGREVQTLWAQQTPEGRHSFTFVLDGKASSGTYFCRMDAGSFSQTIMLVAVR